MHCAGRFSLAYLLSLIVSAGTLEAQTRSKVYTDDAGYQFASQRFLELANSIGVESIGLKGAASSFCKDASRNALIIVSRQLDLKSIDGCAGFTFSEMKPNVPNIGTLYIYSDKDAVSRNPSLSKMMELAVARTATSEEVTFSDHRCDRKPSDRAEPPKGLVPIKAWGPAERVEEAKMTVEPVVFVRSDTDVTAGGSYCFLRVVQIDPDSIFAKSLVPQQLFWASREHGYEFKEGPSIPGHPPVDSPQTLRARMGWAAQHDVNAFAEIYIYEANGPSNVPDDYVKISSRKLLGGNVADTDLIKYVPDCLVIAKSRC